MENQIVFAGGNAYHSLLAQWAQRTAQFLEEQGFWEGDGIPDKNLALTHMAEYVAAQRDTPVERDNQTQSAEMEEEDAQSDEAAEIEGDAEIEAAVEDTGIALAVNTVERPRGELERLRVAALHTLDGMEVRVRYTKGPRLHIISLDEAQSITTCFFNMFGDLMNRIKIVVEDASRNSSVHQGQQLAEADDIPQLFRNIFKNITTIKLARHQSLIEYVQTNIALARFNRNWEKMITHIRDCVDEADEILVYIIRVGINPGGSICYRRLAKQIIIRETGIIVHQFDKFMGVSYTATAMGDVFGNGALLFCPNLLGWNRSGMNHDSAAHDIYAAIRAVDEHDHIFNTSTAVYDSILKPIYDNEAFPWDTHSTTTINTDLPLLQVLESLRPVDI